MKVEIIFENPHGCKHREVMEVKGKNDEKLKRRIRELEKELDCKVEKVAEVKEKK